MIKIEPIVVKEFDSIVAINGSSKLGQMKIEFVVRAFLKSLNYFEHFESKLKCTSFRSSLVKDSHSPRKDFIYVGFCDWGKFKVESTLKGLGLTMSLLKTWSRYASSLRRSSRLSSCIFQLTFRMCLKTSVRRDNIFMNAREINNSLFHVDKKYLMASKSKYWTLFVFEAVFGLITAGKKAIYFLTWQNAFSIFKDEPENIFCTKLNLNNLFSDRLGWILNNFSFLFWTKEWF